MWWDGEGEPLGRSGLLMHLEGCDGRGVSPNHTHSLRVCFKQMGASSEKVRVNLTA